MKHPAITALRRALKLIGGVRLSIETLSWGPHASFIFDGPNGAQHRAGNIAPQWWNDDYVARYQSARNASAVALAALASDGLKLPGLLR